MRCARICTGDSGWRSTETHAEYKRAFPRPRGKAFFCILRKCVQHRTGRRPRRPGSKHRRRAHNGRSDLLLTSILRRLPPRTGEGGPLAVDEGPDGRHQRSAQVPQHAARHSLHQGEGRSPALRDPHPSSGLRETPDATFSRPREKAFFCILRLCVQPRRGRRPRRPVSAWLAPPAPRNDTSIFDSANLLFPKTKNFGTAVPKFFYSISICFSAPILTVPLSRRRPAS